MDKWMRVVRLQLGPQQTIYAAAHQDYSSKFVAEEIESGNFPDEEECGRRVVRHLLLGDRGHFGPLEQAGITLACGYMPHSLMQQLRTHRIGVTFDVMSARYNSQIFLDALDNLENLEKAVYLRPPGEYRDRQGHCYAYTAIDRQTDLILAKTLIEHYRNRINAGYSEEHARGLLPFDYRQHFVISFGNIRALWHMLDMRWSMAAQLEAQWFCDLLWDAIKDELPQLNEWYLDKRAHKARLAP